MTPAVLSAESPVAISAIRFGESSDFGFKNPFCFFDLPAARLEWTATWFGIRSVSTADRKGRQKSTFES
jgi:hypothetical protein